jgi:hypothetical protein
VSLLHDLISLQTAWQRSRNVHGGAWALAGFEYQLSLALLEIVRRFDHGSDGILIEEISDLVVRDNTGLVVTQVKRTLRSDNIRRALEELWNIDCVARTTIPDTANRIRYQIHSARSCISRFDIAISQWQPHTTSAHANEVDAFKEKVSCLTSPDPRLEIASILIRDFRVDKPFAEYARFIGILARSAESLSFTKALQEITGDLAGFQAAVIKHQNNFHLWSETDRPPSTIRIERDESKAVRIGERLTLLDLRQGRLAKRGVYSILLEECEHWLTKDHDTSRIPVFCIHGRSGSGKSAALLHLIAGLHEEDPSRHIVWLGGEVDCLAEAADCIDESLQSGASIVFAIDDPFRTRTGFERGIRRLQTIWQNLLLRANDKGLEQPAIPVVICCSPTEQLEAAKDDCCDDIEIEPVSLPKETIEDYNELAAWYKLRTGTDPFRPDDSPLLVQCLFQWHKGNLEQFAHRFKRRLESFGDKNTNLLFATVSVILALGRLYIDFPYEELSKLFEKSPLLEKAFSQLADEEAHFEFAKDLTTRDSGFASHIRILPMQSTTHGLGAHQIEVFVVPIYHMVYAPTLT